VIDVAALVLRLCCVTMSTPPRRKILVLDEPLKAVRGKGNRQRVRQMLTSLADEMGFQLILNVDIDAYPEFVLGECVELGGG